MGNANIEFLDQRLSDVGHDWPGFKQLVDNVWFLIWSQSWQVWLGFGQHVSDRSLADFGKGRGDALRKLRFYWAWRGHILSDITRIRQILGDID